MQSSPFEEMKQKLAPISAQAKKDQAKKPSLLMTWEEACEAPKKLEYKPNHPIKELCSAARQ